MTLVIELGRPERTLAKWNVHTLLGAIDDDGTNGTGWRRASIAHLLVRPEQSAPGPLSGSLSLNS